MWCGGVTTSASDPQQFDRFAVAYDRYRTIVDRPAWPELSEMGIPEGGRALDVGCGAGHRAAELAQHMRAVVAVDPCVPLIEIARANRASANIRYEAVDVRDHHDVDGYDLIYSANAFHHIAPLGPALAHVRGLLRPGGWAVLSDNVQRSPAWMTWMWRHGGYRLNSAVPMLSLARRLGVRGAWQAYRFDVSKPWVEHKKSDQFLDPDEFDMTYLAAFPGAEVHHHHGATLVWHRPPA
jgi:SAM-dependent methyltransferase